MRQQDAAKLLGVSWETLIRWEKGKQPSIRHWPSVTAFLGYSPLPEPITLGERIRGARFALGLPLKAFAKRLGCDEDTLRMWEGDIREPLGTHRLAVRRLLSGSG